MVTSRQRLAEQRWFTASVTIAVMLAGIAAYVVTDSVLVAFIASCPIGLLCLFVVAPLVDRRRARESARETPGSEE